MADPTQRRQWEQVKLALEKKTDADNQHALYLAEQLLAHYSDSMSRYWAGSAFAAANKSSEAEAQFKAILEANDQPAVVSSAASSLSKLYEDTHNFPAQIALLTQQKQRATSQLPALMYDARLAAVYYAIYNSTADDKAAFPKALNDCINLLRKVTTGIDGILQPPPGDLTPPASAPETVEKLQQLQTACTRALVDAETARLLEAASTDVRKAVWKYGKYVLQSQRAWIMVMTKLKVPTEPPSEELCGWVAKHAQFAANRVKALLCEDLMETCDGFSDDDEKMTAGVCNSHANSVYKGYRLAVAKLMDVIGFCLNTLLPVSSEPALLPRLHVLLGQLGPVGQQAVLSVCELAICYGFSALQPETWQRILQTVNAIPQQPAVKEPLVVQIAKSLVRLTTSAPIGTSSKAAKMTHIQEIESCVKTLEEQLPPASLVSKIPFVNLTLASLHACVSRLGSSFAERNHCRAKASAFLVHAEKDRAGSAGTYFAADLLVDSMLSGLTRPAKALKVETGKKFQVDFLVSEEVTERSTGTRPGTTSLLQLFTDITRCDVTLEGSEEDAASAVIAANRWSELLQTTMQTDPFSAVFMHVASFRQSLRIIEASTYMLQRIVRDNFTDVGTYLYVPADHFQSKTALAALEACNTHLDALRKHNPSPDTFTSMMLLGLKSLLDAAHVDLCLVTGKLDEGRSVATAVGGLLSEQITSSALESSTAGVLSDRASHFVPYMHLGFLNFQQLGFASPLMGLGLHEWGVSRTLAQACRASWIIDHKLEHSMLNTAMKHNLKSIEVRLLLAITQALGPDAPLQQEACALTGIKRFSGFDIPVSDLIRALPARFAASIPVIRKPVAASEKAAQLWKDVRTSDPANAEANAGLCDLFVAAKDYNSAIKLLEETLSRTPKARWALMRYGSLLLSRARATLHQAHVRRLAIDVVTTTSFDKVHVTAKNDTFSHIASLMDFKHSSMGSSTSDDDAWQVIAEEQIKACHKLEKEAEAEIQAAVAAFQHAVGTFTGHLSPNSIFLGTDFAGESGASDRAITAAPQFPSAAEGAVRCWYGLAQAYQLLGKLQPSVQACKTALDIIVTFQLQHPLLASILKVLGEALQSVSEHDDAVLALSASLQYRKTDPGTLYLLAVSNRSLARRYIGDGVLGAGLSCIIEGLTRAVECATLMILERGYMPASGSWLAQLDALVHSSMTSEVAFPVWKLLGDLLSIFYDLYPNSFGCWAAACSVRKPVDFGEILPTSQPKVEPIDWTSITTWFAAHRSHTSLENMYRVCHNIHSTDTSFPPTITAAATTETTTALVSAPYLSAMCYALYADGLKRVNSKDQAGCMAALEEIGVDAASVRHNRAALSSALCDLGRVIFLEYQAILYAAGSTGTIVLADKFADKAARLQRTIIKLALRYSAFLRSVSTVVHMGAAELCPGSARAWNGIGVTEHNPLRAQHALLRSIELQGGGIALINLAALYSKSGRWSLISNVLAQAQTKDPNNTAMWLEIGLNTEAVVRSALAQHDNMAASAFILASDLALHPAALLPGIFHLLRGSTPTFQWTPPCAMRIADSEADLMTMATLVVEKDPNNPFALLAAVRVRSVVAALATYSHAMTYKGCCTFPTCSTDMDVLIRLACPFTYGRSVAQHSASLRSSALAARLILRMWQQLYKDCCRLVDVVAFLYAQSTVRGDEVVSPACNRLVLEARTIAAYAAVMACVYSEPCTEHAIDTARSACLKAIGIVANGDTFGAQQVDMDAIRMPVFETVEAAIPFILYAIVITIGETNSAKGAAPPMLEKAIGILVDVRDNCGQSAVKALHWSVFAVARLLSIFPSLTGLDAHPKEMLRGIQNNEDVAWLTNDLELASCSCDADLQATRRQQLIAKAPAFEWTAWAENGIEASHLEMYTATHPRSVLPWLSLAVRATASAISNYDDVPTKMERKTRATQALRTAQANLDAWMREKRFAVGVKEGKTVSTGCQEDDIVLSTSAGASFVQYILEDLQAQLK